MTRALSGPVACARCASPIDGDERCPGCGVRIEAVADGSALAVRPGPLTGTAVASRRRRTAAVVVDLVLGVLVALGAAVLVGALLEPLQRDALQATLTGAAALVLLLAALTAVLAATGRTPGRAALGLVTLDTLTGVPARSPGHALRAVLAGRGPTLITLDVRRGRDPRAACATALAVRADADGSARAPVVASAPPLPVDAAAVRLLFDTGEELQVSGAVLIGRDPEPQAGTTALHALPDLTRGIARTHLRAEWADGLLWVTDLGSPGGSVLRTDAGGWSPLVPGVRTAVAPGWWVGLGRQSFTVRSLATAEPSGAGAGRG